MPPMPTGPSLKWNERKRWTNWHKTVRQDIAGVYDIYNPLGAAQTSIQGLNQTTAQIQRAIKAATDNGLRCRAVGNGWSLSKAPTTDGVVLNLRNLNWSMAVDGAAIDPAYPGTADDRAGLHLIQCGKNISDVDKHLEVDKKRSLRTSGAANGQSFVGAMSCNTHGSALSFGAVHDHVVGIHLIAGDGQQYWLERASRPVMRQGFAGLLGAEVRRDDDLFNATVVSFGSFGIIHNVMIETRPRFLLDGRTRLMPYDNALKTVIRTLDFTAHPDLAADGTPYFFQAVVNPHANPVEAYVTVMYEKPCPADYQPHYGLTGGMKPGYDVLGLVGTILDTVPDLTPTLVGIAAKQLADINNSTGTVGEMFTYKTPQAKVASGTVAVELSNAARAMDLLIELNGTVGPVPLVFGCRYVRASPALLSFTRFPTTMVVSIDGVYSKRSLAFFEALADRFEAENIPFTQHWGKINHYTPERLRHVYGANVDKWLTARHTFLPTAADRNTFSNELLERLDLED